MNLNEAIKIGSIVSTADGGCDYCVKLLVDLLNEAFSDYEWRIAPGSCSDVEVSEKQNGREP